MQFTFIPIILFTVPILLELIFCGQLFINGKQSEFIICVRVFFIILNVLFLIFCLLGFKLIEDKGTVFLITSNAILAAGKPISKTFVSIVLAADIIVPWMLYRGMPNKRSMKMAELVKEKVA